MCLFQIWFLQCVCPEVVLLGHMAVELPNYLKSTSYTARGPSRGTLITQKTKMLEDTHLKCPENFKFLCSLILISSVFFCITQQAVYFIYFYFNWRLITLQYCSGFGHTLTWISHGFTCISHPEPSSHLPPHPIPLGLPSAPALSTCLMRPTWAGDLFHTW